MSQLVENPNFNKRIEELSSKPTGMWDDPKIAIFIPMERAISHADKVFPAFWNIARQGLPLLFVGYTRTDVARNKAAMQLLNNPHLTHILMLDLDHIHPVDIVLKLARWVIRYPEVKIVGGFNYRRGEPYDPCAFLQGDDGRFYPPADWGEGILEFDAVGTGSLLIDREVFETIKPPFFTYDYKGALNNVWIGEDMTFCERAKEAGFKIYADTTLTSPHMIDAVIDGQSYQDFMQDNDIEIQDLSDVKTLEK